MNPSTKTASVSARVEGYTGRLSGLHDLRERCYASLQAHRKGGYLRRLINGGRAYEYRLIGEIRQLTYQIHYLTLGSL